MQLLRWERPRALVPEEAEGDGEEAEAGGEEGGGKEGGGEEGDRRCRRRRTC